jgi:hypothetical protein
MGAMEFVDHIGTGLSALTGAGTTTTELIRYSMFPKCCN